MLVQWFQYMLRYRYGSLVDTRVWSAIDKNNLDEMCVHCFGHILIACEDQNFSFVHLWCLRFGCILTWCVSTQSIYTNLNWYIFDNRMKSANRQDIK